MHTALHRHVGSRLKLWVEDLEIFFVVGLFYFVFSLKGS